MCLWQQAVLSRARSRATVQRCERFLVAVADLTGDGWADVIGFGEAAVWVPLNNDNGTFGQCSRSSTILPTTQADGGSKSTPRFVAGAR